MSERLKVFLPQLEKANAVLDHEKNGGLEDIEDDGEYIEMVLSLVCPKSLIRRILV